MRPRFHVKRGFDVAVIGGGHAGCEAALAAARIGCKTVLFTLDIDKVALMPCNPAVGGIGKGQLVREIDALGGEMGRNADAAAIQLKVLNRRKGPAVQALRAQTDKKLYEARMNRVLLEQEGLRVCEDRVVEIVTAKGAVTGLRTAYGRDVAVKAVVVATGTFLKGRIVVGDRFFPAGRMGEAPARELSGSFRRLGLELGRFQSATPPRVDARSVDYGKMEAAPGDQGKLGFVFGGEREREQMLCYLTYTTPRTHEVVRQHLHLSPLRSGLVNSRGPRNCPSIDRKIVNFPEKERHPVFVEPEGWETGELYLQGLTTSLPVDVQTKIVQATPGLEDAHITRAGYAVEYDFVRPDQLKPSLETKKIKGLFTAGQINGTTGYEEAAAQGLMAGINAALMAGGCQEFVLDRAQAYVGVLIDDLVTRGVDEPYRMFTSRAEYRLLLRSDNADMRLTPLGHDMGLVSRERMKKVLEKRQRIEEGITRASSQRVNPSPDVNTLLTRAGSQPIRAPHSLSSLLRRPEITIDTIASLEPELDRLPPDLKSSIEADIKYEGYIERQLNEVSKKRYLEQRSLPADVDFELLKGLSYQAKEKFSKVRPRSLGQAARIPGITPADVAVLEIHWARWRRQSIDYPRVEST